MINSGFQIVWVVFTGLDYEAASNDVELVPKVAGNNVTELLLGPQLIKEWLLEEFKKNYQNRASFKSSTAILEAYFYGRIWVYLFRHLFVRSQDCWIGLAKLIDRSDWKLDHFSINMPT